MLFGCLINCEKVKQVLKVLHKADYINSKHTINSLKEYQCYYNIIQ